jgi:conjugative relaxase-like TrwC/TraI family protein
VTEFANRFRNGHKQYGTPAGHRRPLIAHHTSCIQVTKRSRPSHKAIAANTFRLKTMMGLHKLTAGDGYLYLIRQVAAADGTDRGRASLADYYTDKGEAPGRWIGRGLAALARPPSRDPDDPLTRQLFEVPHGSQVSEEQMKALFGEGLHPNADRITQHLTGFGVSQSGALAAARLGRPFRINNAQNAFTRRLRIAYADYNIAHNEDPQASLAPDVRARIRTTVAHEMFAEHYDRDPADDRELSGFIARHSRLATTAVAGYDLTFTPVKSVSALWAIAPRDVAQTVEACHHKAVTDALAFLEDHAAFSRMGADGVEQVNTTGLIAAAFDHRDSRAGDPNLHTHVAVSNKVQALGADGIPRWLALDGTPLHRAAVAASELYNTRLEAHLIANLNVRFTATSHDPNKRPVREIDGFPQQLIERWSSRRSAIEHRVGQLAKTFQTEHGREPTVVEMLALSQQATLETRQAKHEPRSLADQRQTWRTEAVETLGGHRQLARLITDITGHTAPRRRPAMTRRRIDDHARNVIDTVAQTRATWQVNHIRAEAARQLRHTDEHADTATLNRIVDEALRTHSIAITQHTDTHRNEPAALRRRDGASVYRPHDNTVYTSTAVLAAERRILQAASRRGGRTADPASIARAITQHRKRHGVRLNDGQAALVRQAATSGARVQLALAPAGTGKTTAMAVLAAAWRNAGGTVLGLAPTASAAEVLADDLGSPTDTIAKLVDLQRFPPRRDNPAHKWYSKIGRKTLIIVDEAAMASTADLDAVITHAMATGASVRLIGDDQQLASVSAGGVLTDLADRYGALALNTVIRFTDPALGSAEGLASLALRNGDPAGLGFYLDHHRVHVGADDVAADTAYRAWAHDVSQQRDSILLTPTNELVAELNERARLDRLRATTNTTKQSRTVTLGDGLTASAGDWITTRRNARGLRLKRGGWVKNGHRWTIRTVHADGSLTVTALREPARKVRLPADYVAAHTTLGYACTINAAQGVTADTCHTVGCDRLNRQQLYVSLTRGRTANHVYFSTAEADPHRIVFPKATHPPTAVDILTAILHRDGAQRSAHTAQAAEADPVARLHRAAAMYTDALPAGAENIAGPETLARIDTAADRLHLGLTDAQAWPVLRRHLALLSLEGQDPVTALERAADTPLHDAVDPAAVISWRLPPPANARVGPLRWLPAIPGALATHPRWGPYLADRAQLVAHLAAEIRSVARQWDHSTAPAWARPLADDQPELTAEIAVFRAAHGVDAADSRITGPDQYPARSAAVQRLMRGRLDATLRRSDDHSQRWRTLARKLDRHIVADPFWPALARHLDDAARAGADIATLLGEALTRHGPLPDELPAAALWWRLSATLAPPTLSQSDTGLRPPWTAELYKLLGARIAETVIADPQWPALVAAVAAADWPPGDLLSTATEHLRDIAEAESLRPDEYARPLVYRVELLAHHAATVDADVPHTAHAAAEPETVDEPPPDRDYPYAFAEDQYSAPDFAADLRALRAEVALLTAAGVRSPAAMYAVREDALSELDEPGREAVMAIAMRAQAVQVLQIDSSTDTAGVLNAIVSTARHNDRDVVRRSAADTENRAHSTALGALVIVDDAGPITFGQLRSAVEEAERTNSKLLLIAEADMSPPIAALANHLPWAQQLGPSEHPMTTAIERVEHHVATTSGAGPDREHAAELLRRSQRIVERYRELTADHDRSCGGNDRGRDIDLGLD